MKTLLNAVLFGSMFFVALTSQNNVNASEQEFFRTGGDVSKRMPYEHPYLTGIGSSFIGLDFIRSMMGKAPNYLVNVNYGGNTWNYFKDGQLINTVTTPTTSRYFGRYRNFGALLLGYSFYKTYKNKL